MSLNGKVAVVTGAGRGIGRAIAMRLAEDGADVVVADLNAENVASVSREIARLGVRAMGIVSDVTRKADVDHLVAQVVAEYDHIDILVANAGIITINTVLDLQEDEWDRVMDVNAKGVFLCDQAVARQMVKQGGGGKIINCASVAGHQGFPFEAHYCASKFAVIGFSQAFAREVASHGITVNCYCPGIVDTDMWEKIDAALGELNGVQKGESIRKFIEMVPLGRVEKPDDVAGLVSYLASPDSNYMTGQAINICGGIVMR